MPRGTKICSCGVANGPRSHLCKSCKQPFIIKGEVAKAVANPKMPEDEFSGDNLFELADFFEPVDYSQDDTNIRCFDGKAQCWETPDRQYRLRYAKTFMGVQVWDDKFFSLLKRNSTPSKIEWDLVRRFKTCQSSLKIMDLIVKGEPLPPDEDEEIERPRPSPRKKKKVKKR